MAYISTIETGIANLTCKNIDLIASCLNIKPEQLFIEETANNEKNYQKELICIEKSK